MCFSVAAIDFYEAPLMLLVLLIHPLEASVQLRKQQMFALGYLLKLNLCFTNQVLLPDVP